MVGPYPLAGRKARPLIHIRWEDALPSLNDELGCPKPLGEETASFLSNGWTSQILEQTTPVCPPDPHHGERPIIPFSKGWTNPHNRRMDHSALPFIPATASPPWEPVTIPLRRKNQGRDFRQNVFWDQFSYACKAHLWRTNHRAYRQDS